MIASLRVATISVFCCGLSLAANGAFAGQFEINHDTDYIHFTLPGTLGESVTMDWSLANPEDVTIYGLPGIGDFGTPVMFSGAAQTGPLVSLDTHVESWGFT